MPLTKYEGQKFTKGAFIIDECFYVNCVLTDCDLFYAGGNFEWVESRMEGCRWHWRGPALNTLQLLQALGALKAPQSPPLQAVADHSKMN